VGDPWSHRQLCDDGACVGVIGPDGRCGACGKAARDWGDERRRGLLDEDDADRRTEAHVVAREPGPAPDDFTRRRLCPDGGCIGLLDSRGVCKVCGAVGGPAGSPAGRALVDDEADAPADDGEGDGGDDDGEDGEDDGDAAARDDDDAGDGDDAGDDDDDDGDGDDAGDDDDGDDAGEPDDDSDDDAAPAAAAAGRELCPDGACVGLIGDDGRCKVCRLPGERRP